MAELVVTSTIGAEVAWRIASTSSTGMRSVRLEPCITTWAFEAASFCAARAGSTAVPTISISGCVPSAWRTSARPAHAPEMNTRTGAF